MSGRQPPRDPTVATSVGACPSCGANLLVGDRFCGGCGAPVPEESETALLLDLQQVTLGDHEILGILGRGGMGLVYLAHDISLNRKVAVKVLPPSMLQGDASVERFRREARIAASLRHRHITSVFGLKETTKVVFFVMEYVEGRTLDAILHDEGRLAIDAVEAIIHDTAGALSYAHRREVVHRDLKPANVIIDVEGMAMITDFGVAKVSTSQGLTTAGSTVGSPKYMSPEQWSGKASSLSDQYALGCLAYELLAGRGPFEGDTIEELMKQQLFDTPQPLIELRPDAPPALADAVMRMLLKDPAQRWPSLDAAVAAIGLRPVPPDDPVRVRLAQSAKRGHDVRALPKTPKSPIPISKISLKRSQAPTRLIGGKRPPWLWAAAAGVVAVIAVGGYLLFRSPSSPSAGTSGPSVAAIEIADAPATLNVGERASVTAHPKDAAGAMLASAPVAWSSSDPRVAAISSDGMVTGVAPGSATLTAASGGKTAGVTITVAATASAAPVVATLEVLPRRARISSDETTQLTAVAKDSRGERVTGRRVEWSSSDPAVVAVSSSGVAKGASGGTATVAATSDGKSATATITVESGAVETIDITPAQVKVALNRTVPLRAIAKDGRGNVVRRRVEWASSDPRIASVSRSGLVTGVAPGTTTIIASGGGARSGPVAVTVTTAAAPAGPPGLLQMLIVPWANVSIDGSSRGQRTRGVDTLSSGAAHRVRFERDGFVTIDSTVTLQAGEQRLMRIQMTPRKP